MIYYIIFNINNELNFLQKVVDLEQKTEQVQTIYASILSNLVKKWDNYTFETQSILINHFILDSSNLPSVLVLKNSSIVLPSFCELISNINKNCNDQTIILKVF